MRYYKILTDNRPSVIGIGDGGIEITEAEYNHIKSIIDSRPTAPEGFGYRLTPALEWELYALPPVEETEPTEEEYAEAGKILLGVSQ
jgi:hypothetical protein